MLRGCKRNMIVLRGTGSDLFEEAYFVVKEEAERRSETDMLEEAERIIDKSSPTRSGATKRIGLFSVLGFLFGLFCGIFALLPFIFN
jgi:hypothetical protein